MADPLPPSIAAPAPAAPLPLESSYGALPETFYARVAPTPVAQPHLLRLNRPLAELLGLDPEYLVSPEGVLVLAGSRLPSGAEPLAMAYAGHQFGQFVPSLGDGRAVLLGEVVGRDGVRRDLHLKGAGRTPFSRGGDGRAALGPVLREYVLSEAMAALGIPTTRALAMVVTGEPVYRERALPGAVLARVARSHLRVGTFEYFARRGQHDAVRTLADYAIARLVQEAADAESPYRAFLEEVARRQAELIARWMGVGFIHGVMNTDNMAISGETLDYGPCAFMDAYHPGTVYSSIDHLGRYAYDQQPGIGGWNLARLAEALLPLLGDGEEAQLASAHAALERYARHFEASHAAVLRAKLGLARSEPEDPELAGELLAAMAAQQADFTLTFRRLSEVSLEDPESFASTRALFADPAPFDRWTQRWRRRLASEGREEAARRAAMRTANPAFIPRNHRVQQAIDAAERGELQPLDDLIAVTTQPYADHPELADYQRPPEPHEVVRQTFCGT